MEQQELIKINVTNKPGEKVLVGGDFHVLTDETRGVLQTNNLQDFISFVKNQVVANRVFYHNKGAQAFASLVPKFHDLPVAACVFEEPEIVKYLRSVQKNKMDTNGFDDFLRSVQKYLTGADTMKIMDFLNNVQISKVKTVQRQTDHRGNFAYSVKTEKGQGDFEFPKQIKFSIPLVQGLKINQDIVFDFFFTWEEVDETVGFTFQIKNIDFEEIIKEAIGETVKQVLLAEGLNITYGLYEIKPMTNDWTYKSNPLLINR